jgi:hypothetical protein
MNVTRISDSLWRWTAPHPAWKPTDESPTGWDRDVGCLLFEPEDGGIILIEPLVPAGAEATFWKHLDRDVERRGGRVRILIANAWHGRSAREVRARYGAAVSVHAHRDVAKDVQADVTHAVEGDVAALPGGVTAHRVFGCDGGECILELPRGQGLVFADAVMEVGGGELRTLPSAWTPKETRDQVQPRLRELLRSLLDRPLERLLPSHGEPVLRDAHAALERAIAAAPKGGG